MTDFAWSDDRLQKQWLLTPEDMTLIKTHTLFMKEEPSNRHMLVVYGFIRMQLVLSKHTVKQLTHARDKIATCMFIPPTYRKAFFNRQSTLKYSNRLLISLDTQQSYQLYCRSSAHVWTKNDIRLLVVLLEYVGIQVLNTL